ncbi:MAG TPA: ArsA-related P-loop ATPase [Polyangiaceae bacterium]|nr:ArsA-related P-loop ATPase [Polyangiaceae bacterium]
MSLGPLIASRRVILCVGCGGVGKTTTAAAVGLAAAAQGKRTLCLTVDPARRLAESLGLSEMKHEAQHVERARFEAAGLEIGGSLTVMMLDPKGTFDELVTRYASSPEVRDRILRNTLYRYISTSLAGTAEYMAMEKLYALRGDPRWDVIVIDTPPTANALDFLDAPERMIEALDSPVFRWLVAAFEGTGKLSVNLLARGAAAALRGMGRLTGTGFLEALAELIVLLNEMLGGFRARADEVRQALRGPDVAYVLVTSPDPLSIREIQYFADRLRELSMPRDAVVVNRVRPVYAQRPSAEAVRVELDRRGVQLAADAEMRVLRAFDDETREGELDRRNLAALAGLNDGAERPIRVDVPALAGDVHDLRALAKVAAALAPV